MVESILYVILGASSCYTAYHLFQAFRNGEMTHSRYDQPPIFAVGIARTPVQASQWAPELVTQPPDLPSEQEPVPEPMLQIENKANSGV